MKTNDVYISHTMKAYLIKTHFQVLFFLLQLVILKYCRTLTQKIVMMFWISMYHVTTIKDKINSFVLSRENTSKLQFGFFPKHVLPALRLDRKLDTHLIIGNPYKTF